jgi:hypothetical protein
MTREGVELLFDEFAAAHARGERPDVRGYLTRAGAKAEELGLLIDRYLQAVPAEPPDEETVVLLQARLDHVDPLVAARIQRGLRVRELVDRLRDALGLGVKLRDRLEEAYSDLERGQLDAGRVDERVWDALRAILGLDVHRLAGATEQAAGPGAFYRRPDQAPAKAAERSLPAEREPDEVDRLFGTWE